MKKFTKTLIFLLSVLCIVSVAGFAACQKEGGEKTDDVCKHDYKVISTVAATCEAGGSTTYKCSLCGEEKNETVNALGHSFGDWTVKTPATCETAAEEERKCSRCGKTEERTSGEALGHNGEWKVVEEATCIKDGKEEKVCSRCGKKEERAITDRPAHNYAEETEKRVEATCTEEGKEFYRCTTEGCTEEYSEAIPPKGHQPDYTVEEFEPTCVDDGYISYHCGVCYAIYDEAGEPAFGHEWKEFTEAATCEHGSMTGRKCERCETAEAERKNDRLSHSFGANGVCGACNKHYTEANIFSVSESSYGVEFTEGVYKFTANNEVLSNGKTFDFTVDKDGVNEYIKAGYNQLTLTFGRKNANMATQFKYGEEVYNDKISVTLNLEADKDATAFGVSVQTIGGWIGLPCNPNNPEAGEWVAADGFSLTLATGIAYKDGDPRTYISSGESFTYENGKYVFPNVKNETNGVLAIRAEYIAKIKEQTEFDTLRITASINSDNGRAIGYLCKGYESTWGWTDKGKPLARDFEIASLSIEDFGITVAYGIDDGTTPGFSITLELVNAPSYEAVSTWFNPYDDSVTVTAVGENSFDFATSGSHVISFKQEAIAWLIKNGYTKIKVTYSTAGDNMSLYPDGEAWNTAPVWTEGNTVSREFDITGGNAFSVHVAKSDNATSFNIVFEAVK